MNTTLKDIRERRSCRTFKPDMVPKDIIQQIIEAGLFAENGQGKLSTKIIAVTNKEMRDKLVEDNCKVGGWPKGFDPFYGAPVILIVVAEKGSFSSLYDGTLVMGNLMLAAHALGLGSVWIHRAKQIFEKSEYIKLLNKLGLKGNYEGIAHLALGYIDGTLPPAELRKKDRIFWIE